MNGNSEIFIAYPDTGEIFSLTADRLDKGKVQVGQLGIVAWLGLQQRFCKDEWHYVNKPVHQIFCGRPPIEE